MSRFSDSQERKLGMILSYAHTAVSAIISIIYIPILLNGIGKSEYGLYQLLGSVIAYFSTMYSSLNASVMKYYTQYLINGDEKNIENTLAISRRIFIAVSIIIVAVSVPVSFIFETVYSESLSEHEMTEALAMFAIMIANLLVYLNNSIYSASIMSNEKFIFRRSLDLVSQVLQPIGVVLFIKRYPYAITIVSIQLALNIAVAIANIFYSKHKLNVKVVYHGKDSALVRGLLSLSGSVLFVTIADQIFWKTDQLILAQMYGTEVVAVYSIGSQLNTIFISVGIVMGGVLLPLLTKIIANDKDGSALSKAFAQIGRYQSYIVMLALTGIILFGREFIVILAGEDFLEAYNVTLLLIIPYTVDLIQNSGNTILQAKNEYWYRAKILFVAAIINIFLTVLMARKFGMEGAAGATSIAIIVTSWFIMNYIYSSKVGLNIRLFWKNVIPVWIRGIVPFAVGIAILKINIANRIIQFAVHVILYCLVYLLFITITMKPDERKTIYERLIKK